VCIRGKYEFIYGSGLSGLGGYGWNTCSSDSHFTVRKPDVCGAEDMLRNRFRAGAQELEARPGCALEHPGFKKKVGDIFHDRFYTTFGFVCKEALLP